MLPGQTLLRRRFEGFPTPVHDKIQGSCCHVCLVLIAVAESVAESFVVSVSWTDVSAVAAAENSSVLNQLLQSRPL